MSIWIRSLFIVTLSAFLFFGIIGGESAASEQVLHVGWASVDITPTKAVALAGQLHKRISKYVKDPLYATALALETRSSDGRKEEAILISCDLIFVYKRTQDKVKELLKARIPDFNADKVFMNATHTHTGPPTEESYGKLYDVSSKKNVMGAIEYGEFFLNKVVDAAAHAWQARKPSGLSWALGHAVIGYNRRTVYSNGRSVMYGNTSELDFQNLEGPEDHSLELLFFWNEQNQLTGIVINVACPAQMTEAESFVSADFWHEVREEVHKCYGKKIFILPQCAAAGDLSPHLLWRKRAEELMIQRKGVSPRQEIAHRILMGINEVFPYARSDIRKQLVFKHQVIQMRLPMMSKNLLPFYDTDPSPVEVHILRLGDVAMATNPFELFLEYGIRIKARSKAILTLLIQLCSQNSGYLPTEKAVRAGGYSAERYIVGPEGGRVLVNETVKYINRMWE